ncbi:MAG TPA: hypothetical protein VFH48_45545 [Chloroflexota bacterium]|nr:hypothetical protein [Chloroflexota bacterium]
MDEGTFWALAPRYAAHGLILHEARPATGQEIAGARSTWAKRLGAGGRRPAWLLRFERIEAAGAGAMPHLEAAT